MLGYQTELVAVLQGFNPWWSGREVRDLPEWERFTIRLLQRWMRDPSTVRALVLTGARQTGKTTLFRQAIRDLLESGFPRENILFATFDHPLMKLSGIEKTVEAWRTFATPRADHPIYLFLDEVQQAGDWQVWIKHQVDFHREYRIAVTGSAVSLVRDHVESGVGRWETVLLPTLSFREFLKLTQADHDEIPELASLRRLFEWGPADFAAASAAHRSLLPLFHDYLLRGGFPEPALSPEITRCQRLLREDVIDKILKRDMPSLHGVRKAPELERLFIYLCFHDGGIADLAALTRDLGINKQTLSSFLDLLEANHLVYRLKVHGYGKEVLRGRDKFYLADPALPGAMMLRGTRLLEDADKLGRAVEAAFFKHLMGRYYADRPRFTYWREGKQKEQEVDVIAEFGGETVPFEVKYQDTAITGSKLAGMRTYMDKYGIDRGYAITRRIEDFGPVPLDSVAKGREREPLAGKAMRIPAPLACYWLSQ